MSKKSLAVVETRLADKVILSWEGRRLASKALSPWGCLSLNSCGM